MSVNREVITGPEVPSGIGPYSAAVRAGDFLYVSGQPGVDPTTAKPVGEGFAEQARQAFANLDAVLRAGGSAPALVVEHDHPGGRRGGLPGAERVLRRVLPDRAARADGHAGAASAGLRISVGCVALVEPQDAGR